MKTDSVLDDFKKSLKEIAKTESFSRLVEEIAAEPQTDEEMTVGEFFKKNIE